MSYVKHFLLNAWNWVVTYRKFIMGYGAAILVTCFTFCKALHPVEASAKERNPLAINPPSRNIHNIVGFTPIQDTGKILDNKKLIAPILSKIETGNDKLDDLKKIALDLQAQGLDVKDLKGYVLNLTDLTRSQGDVIKHLQQKLVDTVNTLSARQRIANKRAEKAEDEAAAERAEQRYRSSQSQIGEVFFHWWPVLAGLILIYIHYRDVRKRNKSLNAASA